MSNVTQQDDRFEIAVDGETAGHAQFLDRGDRRIFFHTEIGDEFGGQGLGGDLVGEALRQTRDQGLTPVAVCPFVAGYAEKHPEVSVAKPRPEDLQGLQG